MDSFRIIRKKTILSVMLYITLERGRSVNKALRYLSEGLRFAFGYGS